MISHGSNPAHVRTSFSKEIPLQILPCMVVRKFPRNTGPALARKFPQNPRRSTSVKKIPCNVATLCCEKIPLQSWTSFGARKFPRNTGPAWSQGNSLTELWRRNVIAKLDQHGGEEISLQYWTSLVARKFPCNTVPGLVTRKFPHGAVARKCHHKAGPAWW